jgi:WD40 repeat protein
VLTIASSAGADRSEAGRVVRLDLETGGHAVLCDVKYPAVASVTPCGTGFVLMDAGLRLVRADSGDPIEISGACRGYSLSPDGKTLAYADGGIWLYDLETGSRRKIDDGWDACSPVWFPDGKNLLFVGDLGVQLGDGAGHLQGIFRLNVDDPGSKTRIIGDWEGKFRYIRWIMPGEIAHVEEGWDDGYNSVVLDLATLEKRDIVSLNRGGRMVYRPSHDSLVVLERDGSMARMDFRGTVISRLDLAEVGGFRSGAVLTDFALLPDGRLLFFHKTPLQDHSVLWMTGPGLEEPVPLSRLPAEIGGGISVSPSGRSLAVNGEGRSLLIVTLE